MGSKEQLLTTAIRMFGQSGYDAVSTRNLAEAAGVNVALINYHFGGKQELYIGAIDHIVGIVQPRLSVIEEMARQAQTVAGDDPQRQATLIAQLVDNVLTLFFETPALHDAIPFVLRELFMPGPHFERLYDALPRRLHELMTGLVAWITGLPPESDQAKIRTHAVVGQIIVFHLGRTILLKRLHENEYTPAIQHEIRRQVTTSVLNSLELPHVE